MCLITNQLEPYVAKEDIIVYKLLKPSRWKSDRAISVFYNTEYEIGKEYKIPIQVKNSKTWETMDEEDFKEMSLIPEDDTKAYTMFGEGIHSAVRRDRLERARRAYHGMSLLGDCDVYKCTIPKGAEYYEGLTGLIVSNKLIINKRL